MKPRPRSNLHRLSLPDGRLNSIVQRHAPSHLPKTLKIACVKNPIFVSPFKLIWVVQSLSQKFHALRFSEIVICYPHSAATRGAYRDRHETWGGMRWT